MSARIIATAGHAGSGKGELSEYMALRYGAHHVTMSDPLKETLQRFGINPHDRQNTSALVTFLRELRGPEFFYYPFRFEIEKTLRAGGILIIDGIRTPDVAEVFRKKIPNFQIIAIHASDVVRLARIKERARSSEEANMTMKQLASMREVPTETQIDEVMAGADFRVENNGSLEAFHADIDRVLQVLQS